MAKRNSSKKKLKRRIMFFGLFSCFVIVALSLTIGKYWISIYNKYQEKKLLEEELLALQAKEKELQLDAKKLQNSEYIARYVREKYYFSKEGEFIIKIPEDE